MNKIIDSSRLWITAGTLLVLLCLTAPGCLTAPIGFYETAFPENRSWSFGGGFEMVRVVSDAQDKEDPPYSEGTALRLNFGYAPIPRLTLGTMIYNQGFALKTKVAIANGDIWAVGLITLLGISTADHQFGVSATSGAIFSIGNSHSTGPRSFQFAFNLGPKVVTTYATYDNESHWKEALIDVGGFVGLTIEFGPLDIGLEFTMLSAERPWDSRELAMFGGIFIDGHWSIFSAD
jgi:hypothetical protein